MSVINKYRCAVHSATLKIENCIIRRPQKQQASKQLSLPFAAQEKHCFNIKNVQNMEITTIARHFVIDAEYHDNKMRNHNLISNEKAAQPWHSIFRQPRPTPVDFFRLWCGLNWTRRTQLKSLINSQWQKVQIKLFAAKLIALHVH